MAPTFVSGANLRNLGRTPYRLALRTIDADGNPDGVISVYSDMVGKGTSFVYSYGARVAGLMGATVDSGTLTLRTWSTSTGSWSAVVACDEELRQVLIRHFDRGRAVALYAELLQQPGALPILIAAGKVRQVSGLTPAVTVQVWDIVGSIQTSRWDPTTVSSITSLRLFASLPTDAVRVAYSSGDNVLDVDSTTGFTATDTEANHTDGIVRVTPNSGDPFYLTYSNGSTTAQRFTLTGECAGSGADADMYYTTRATSGVSNLVEGGAIIWGTPWEIAEKVVCSTGAATNGAYDTLTEGIGVPSALVGISSSLRLHQPTTSVGSYHLDVIAFEAVENPLTWMQEWLAPLGMILVARGQMEMRVIHDPQQAPSTKVVVAITDDDIIDVGTVQSFDDSTYVFYFRVDLNNSRGDGASVANDTPDPRHPLKPDSIAVEPFAWGGAFGSPSSSSGYLSAISGTSYIADEYVPRLARWYHDAPERIVLTVHASTGAQLVMGDIIELTTARWTPRRDDTYTDHRMLVLRSVTLWPGASSAAPVTRLELAALPAEYDDPV